ncbi:MAG: branched-chain amino acid ABC transporter permease [Clostridia bacterium]|nr:branched-chain amino acid ABC transporter permease [Clostridia bacterium]
MLNTIIDGLSLGAIYALIALGYTMVYGIAKMLNFAHGDIIMVGAYAILSIMMINAPVVSVILAIIVSIAVCTVLGIVVERTAYRPLRGASPLAVLITAIGVSYLLQGMAQLIFGVTPRTVDFKIPGNIGGIPVYSIVTLIVASILMVGLTLFVKYTRTGRAMVAVSEDRGAAQLMGVNVNAIIAITFAIGSALAACASIFYVMQIPKIDPTLGSMPGIKAFTAAVIGGIGSLPGAMLGGVLLGLVEKITQSIPFLSAYTTAIEFSLLIIILLVKPSGLLGKKRNEKV